MAGPLVLLAALRHYFFTAINVFLDLGRLVAFGLRSRRALAAENLFSPEAAGAVSATEG
jgi:hypothetical protein